MAAEHFFQRQRDLADRGIDARGAYGEFEQVFAALRRAGECIQRLSTAPTSRVPFSRCSFDNCLARTSALSIFSTSTSISFSGRCALTPTRVCSPESMRAWVRAAASSMRSFGMPFSIAAAMPPRLSTSSIWASARAARSCVSRSTKAEPPHGSTMRVVPDSFCRMSCVLRAMRAEWSVGSAIASSKELVCSDWVWPCVAAIASTMVRVMLL
ncbi:hypothetical protein AJ88_08560 [Mesorhizobium amorphae CCBAU 01583]|nr:hypothetical protein AJ88_08560 [Mesorhizobium amorphae CCBAU 01583]